jgi:hypothetical protein
MLRRSLIVLALVGFVLTGCGSSTTEPSPEELKRQQQENRAKVKNEESRQPKNTK